MRWNVAKMSVACSKVAPPVHEPPTLGQESSHELAERQYRLVHEPPPWGKRVATNLQGASTVGGEGALREACHLEPPSEGGARHSSSTPPPCTSSATRRCYRLPDPPPPPCTSSATRKCYWLPDPPPPPIRPTAITAGLAAHDDDAAAQDAAAQDAAVTAVDSNNDDGQDVVVAVAKQKPRNRRLIPVDDLMVAPASPLRDIRARSTPEHYWIHDQDKGWGYVDAASVQWAGATSN